MAIDRSTISRPRPWRRPVRQAAAIVAVLALGGLIGTQLRSDDAAQAASSVDIPSSPEIEATFGVRFTGAYLTADGGMIELVYLVLDADLAPSLHSDDTVVALRYDDMLFDSPGLAGHGHAKTSFVPGRSLFTLLANTEGRLASGSVVDIVVDDLVLHGVTLL